MLNRTVRKATKPKTRDMQAEGSGLNGHRRSVSFSNNGDVGENCKNPFSLKSQKCCSEGRDNFYHENNSEHNLINRSNKRLWSHLDRETGSKIWKAMESLGVVHEEVVILERLDKLESQFC